VALEYQHLVFNRIAALPQIEVEDLPLVHEYAVAATGLRIVDLWLSEVGTFLKGAKGEIKPQPILHWRKELVSQLVTISRELGLSPTARARLVRPEGGQGSGLAAAILELGESTPAEAGDTK
jgi:P27 family predicted phage terminase small subunit